jgi:hypothetical protein
LADAHSGITDLDRKIGTTLANVTAARHLLIAGIHLLAAASYLWNVVVSLCEMIHWEKEETKSGGYERIYTVKN